MRSRVARKFARVPGMHGDHFAPMFYPQAISPGLWGTPWGKVKSAERPMMFTLGFFFCPAVYWMELWQEGYLTRMTVHGCAGFDTSMWGYSDLDNPDWEIMLQASQEESRLGLKNIRHGGINYLASYAWKPGDPEPDLRLRLPPSGH
jgi:hypothetical protein